MANEQIEKIRFWCQTVLPTIYDDSLSYYECLSKFAEKLNEIGEVLAKEYGVLWLPSDFKKKDGYKQSIELSKEYGLYRQNYCGCVYSRQEREE